MAGNFGQFAWEAGTSKSLAVDHPVRRRESARTPRLDIPSQVLLRESAPKIGEAEILFDWRPEHRAFLIGRALGTGRLRQRQRNKADQKR